MKPATVFARGKAHESVIIASNPVTVTSATGYVAGVPVFASNADGTGAKFLGYLVSKDGNALSLSLGDTTEWGAGATAWVASSYWRPVKQSLPKSSVQEIDNGVERLETVGGSVHTQTRPAREYVTFYFEMLSAADWLAYRVFVRDVLSDGIKQFTATWFDLDSGLIRTATAKLENPGERLSATTVGSTRKFVVVLELQEEERYA